MGTESILLKVLVSILIGYSLGNFSPSYLIGKRAGHDVRHEGSGNAGATNAYLIAGKAAFFIVAILDIFKAYAACRICRWLFPDFPLAEQIGGVACILGHLYPIILGFRGGRGLSCQGGVILAWSWRWFLLLLGAAILLTLITRYVCFVSPAVSVSFPAIYYFRTGYALAALVLLIPALPIFKKHMVNFARIRTGQEARISYLWNKDAELKRMGRSE